MPGQTENLSFPAARVVLQGNLTLPASAGGIVLFAHGSGSSRSSPRNQQVASVLNEANIATLLMDLLTGDEKVQDALTAHWRFNIPLLAERMMGATDWVHANLQTRNLVIGYFGASTGAAAALVAAADRGKVVRAVVSRGGRPDLAGPSLAGVRAPTLLIVGGNDQPVINMNREALTQLTTTKRLDVIPGATHLFEEPGALEQVAVLARDWFQQYLH